MGNVASASSDESSILILCSLEWSPTQFVLQCDQWFHDGLIFFFHYLLLLEWTFQSAFIPSPCSFFCLLRLEWSLNLSTDKKSNAICIFANLCSTLFSLWFKFPSALVLLSVKMHKKKRAKANREKFKSR